MAYTSAIQRHQIALKILGRYDLRTPCDIRDLRRQQRGKDFARLFSNSSALLVIADSLEAPVFDDVTYFDRGIFGFEFKGQRHELSNAKLPWNAVLSFDNHLALGAPRRHLRQLSAWLTPPGS